MIELFGAGFDDRDPHWRQPPSRTTTYALALVVSGKLNYRINDVTLHLSKGDLLYLPSGCMREAAHADHDHHRKYWATFSIANSGDVPLPMLNKQEPFAIKTRQFEYMKQRFEQLVPQWMGKLSYYQPICSAILTDVLGRMNRERDDRHHPSPMLNLLASIQDYVLAHYREDIKVERLARLVNRSPNYISSLFRRLTGNSLKAYINEVKLSAARDLLFHSNVSIGQAAEYVGYCDQAYFNRVFKRTYGFPPSAMLKDRGRAVPRGDGERGALDAGYPG